MTYPRRPRQVSMQRPRTAGDANGSRPLGRGPAEARSQIALDVQLAARPRPIARLRGAPIISVSAAARARIAAAVRGASALSITVGARPEMDASHLLRFGEGEYFRWNDVEYASPLNIPGAVFTSLDPITDIVGGRLVTFAAGTLPASVNGLLMWPEDRTNRCWHSATATGNDFLATGVTRATSAVTLFDGTTNALKLIEGTTSQVHTVQQNPYVGPAPTAGQSACLQIAAKAAERQGISFGFNGAATRAIVHVNLLTGAILGQGLSNATITLSDVIPLVDGWWLIRIAATPTGAGIFSGFRLAPLATLVDPASVNGETYTGDGASGILYAYPQFEANAAQPGPLILSLAAGGTVTRRANRLVLPFTPPAEGIFFAEVTPRTINSAYGRLIGLTSPRTPLSVGTTTGNRMSVWNGANNLGFDVASSTLNRRFRSATGYSAAGRASSADGSAALTDANPLEVGGTSTQLAIGSHLGGGDPLPGHYHRIAFHRARADARLPALTSTPVVGPTHWLRFDPSWPLYRWGGKNYATLLDIPGVAFTQLDPITDIVDGQLVTFAAGVPAISKNGLLLWPEDRTNLARWSQDFSNALWIFTNATMASGVSDPAGGNNAVTVTATAANGQFLQIVGGSLGSGSTYTTSFWMRRRSGSGTVWIFNPDAAGVAAVSLTTQWQRFSASGPGAPSNNLPGIRIASSGDQIDVYAGQLEVGAVASPYIATTSAIVTRRANRLVLPWQITPAGMMVAEFTQRGLNANARVIGLQASHAPIYLNATTGVGRTGMWNESIGLESGPLITWQNTRRKAAVAWSPAGRITAFDGATRNGDANAFNTPGGWAYTQLAIGTNVNGANPFPAHFHSVSIFGFRDDSRLPSLTT